MAVHRAPTGGAARRAAGQPPPHSVPATIGWTGAGAVLAATSLLLSLHLPPSLTLLATGCVLATAGFVMAAALYASGWRMGRDGVAGWDLASSLLFLGLAAVLLTDMGEALGALGELRWPELSPR
jgi:hypothetical protein